MTYRHCMVVFNQYPLGETRVQREAEALIRSGYQVDVICKREPHEPKVDNYKNVRIYREKYRLRIPFVKEDSLAQQLLDYLGFFITAFFRLNVLTARNHHDSIQVHNLPDFLVFCVVLQKLKHIPVILDLHDLMPEFYAGKFSRPDSWILRLIRWQEHLACNFADHVITVSEHWRSALIQRGVPPGKCSVVMNVADRTIFHPQEKSTPPAPDPGNFRLIYHGSMVWRYGLDLAVEAVDQLRGQIPGLHLTLLGQGDYLAELQTMVEQRKLHETITFEPRHLAEDLPEFILSHDLGIVPYRNDVFTDGLLPTKLMEYAALGLPAVASRTTAIALYFSGTNTEFFEPGNTDDLARCILRLYLDPARLSLLRKDSQVFNDRYNWDVISREYVSLVQQLCSRHKTPLSEAKFAKQENSPD